MACFNTVCGLFHCCVAGFSVVSVCFSAVHGPFQCFLWPVSVLCVACFSAVCGLFQCCVWPVSVMCAACVRAICGLFQCSLKELPELVELYLAGNPVTLEDGECPTYHTDIQAVLPALEIVDGVRPCTQTYVQTVSVLRPAFVQSVLRPAFIEVIVLSQSMYLDMHSVSHCTDLC